MPKVGNMKHLQRESQALVPPEEEQVQIEVKAIGLNFADVFAMQGLYEGAPKRDFIPGLEFSGEVIKTGAAVQKWRVGDKVMGATKFGGYVSHLNHHEDYLSSLPHNWSYPQGAGFIVQGLTAYYALCELGNLQNGKRVLIQSGAGGVGILANRICKQFGAHTIGTVSSQRKADFLQEFEDYDEVIVREKKLLPQIQKAKGDERLDIVLETLGGKAFFDCYKAMSPMGRLITFGSGSFMNNSSKPNLFKLIPQYLSRPKLDVMKMPKSNKSVMGFNLIFIYDQVELLQQMLGNLLALNLKPQYVGQTFSFEQLPDALAQFRSGKTIGKVVITP